MDSDSVDYEADDYFGLVGGAAYRLNELIGFQAEVRLLSEQAIGMGASFFI